MAEDYGLEHMEFTKETSGLIDSSYLEPKVETPTNVVFSEKKMSPNIVHTSGFTKNILFLSLKLNGGNVVDISNDKVFILKYLIINDTLTMAVAFSDKDPNPLSLSISKDNGLMDKITFTPNKLTISVHREELPLKINKYFEGGFKIRRFIPNKPTYMIVTHKMDLSTLGELLGQTNPNFDSKHSIRAFSTKEELNAIIKTAVEEGYTAVTYFMPVEVDEMFRDSVFGKNYAALYKAFQLVHTLQPNGKVVKSKKKKVVRKGSARPNNQKISNKKSTFKKHISK